MHRRVGIVEATVVIAEQVAALALGQKTGKGLPCLGKDLAHSMHEPIELALSREEYPAQDETEAALWMRLGIGECECRSP